MNKICLKCGKVFIATTNGTKRKYCSRECAYESMRTKGFHKICPQCGKEFYAPRKKGVCCSFKCGKVSQKNRVKTICQVCGKEVERQGSKADRKFCSVECGYKGRVIQMSEEGKERMAASHRGPKNNNWKGGPVHYGDNWRKQSREARKRDGACRICGALYGSEDGRELHVHHIIPFRQFGIEHYQEANDLSNLIVLCASCHRRIELGQIHLQ